MEVSCLATSIGWDRVHLHIDIKASLIPSSALPLRFRKRKGNAVSGNHPNLTFDLKSAAGTFPLKVVAGSTPGTYRVKVNVTNLRTRHEIPDGTWKIIPVLNGKGCIPVSFDPSHLSQLYNWSRTFLFDSNKQAYVVNFDLSDDDERPELVVRTYYLTRDIAEKKIEHGLKTKVKVWLLKDERQKKLLQLWYRIWHVVVSPPGNRILFTAQQRTQLEGNLLCVRDRLKSRNLDRYIDTKYWYDIKPQSFFARMKNNFRLARLIAISDIVLLDDYCSLLDSIDPDPTTVIAQLWHAGYGFKAVGFSRFGRYGSPQLDSGHRKYTYAICGAASLQPVYAEVFGIEQKAVLATGLPRIDQFLDPDSTTSTIKNFRDSYPQFINKKIILFAPTFRGRGHGDAHYDYSRIDFASLYDWCGANAVVLIRMHPFIKDSPPIPEEYRSRLVDFADYPSTNDLLHVVDILITDYSSIVYEFSLLNRPMLFFAYDEIEYQATRGFHCNYRKLAPGKICNTFSQLLEALTFEDYEFSKVAQYRDRYIDYKDTGSTDRVINQIILPSIQKSGSH